MSRALNCRSELSLMPGANARALSRNDLPEGRKVSAQGVRVFVIDMLDAVHAKKTIFRNSLLISFLHHIG